MLNELLAKIAKLPKILSILLLIMFIILLYVSLQKVIMPGVMKVVESDFFFQNEEEQEELGKISNERSQQAFFQCKSVMISDRHVPENAQFAESEYEAWALGGRTYLIRSHVNVPAAENGMTDRKYACKIKYSGGEMSEAKSWDILGVDFNEPTN